MVTLALVMLPSWRLALAGCALLLGAMLGGALLGVLCAVAAELAVAVVAAPSVAAGRAAGRADGRSEGRFAGGRDAFLADAFCVAAAVADLDGGADDLRPAPALALCLGALT